MSRRLYEPACLQTKELVKEEVMEQVGGTEQQVSQLISIRLHIPFNQLSDFPKINEEAGNPFKMYIDWCIVAT